MIRLYFLMFVFLFSISCNNSTDSGDSDKPAHIKVVSLFSYSDNYVQAWVLNDGGTQAMNVSIDVTATDGDTGKKETNGFNFGFVKAGEKKVAVAQYSMDLGNASLVYYNLFWE